MGTSRFAVRTLDPDDVDWITEACNDPDIQRWTTVPRPYHREHAEEFVHTQFTRPAGAWAIVDVHDDRPVGVIGIHGLDPASGVATVGYWIAPSGRRRGAASEALNLLVQRARLEPGVIALHAIIASTNTASRRTAERAGFVDIGPHETSCPDGTAEVEARSYRRALDA